MVETPQGMNKLHYLAGQTWKELQFGTKCSFLTELFKEDGSLSVDILSNDPYHHNDPFTFAKIKCIATYIIIQCP